MILVVYAHPYPGRSRGCAALLAAISELPHVEVRSLYQIYPDFDIDPAAEQAALARARVVVWLHPLYWYAVPALMKHWFERVLAPGFAFGREGSSLEGKDCLWVTTTGAGDYALSGIHHHPFEAFTPAVEMTARFCGMSWLEPFVVHDVSRFSEEALRECGRKLRDRLEAFAVEPAE